MTENNSKVYKHRSTKIEHAMTSIGVLVPVVVALAVLWDAVDSKADENEKVSERAMTQASKNEGSIARVWPRLGKLETSNARAEAERQGVEEKLDDFIFQQRQANTGITGQLRRIENILLGRPRND